MMQAWGVRPDEPRGTGDQTFSVKLASLKMPVTHLIKEGVKQWWPGLAGRWPVVPLSSCTVIPCTAVSVAVAGPDVAALFRDKGTNLARGEWLGQGAV
jgi:hypothetical protein